METRASYVIVGAFVFALAAATMGFVMWVGKVDIDKAVKQYRTYFTSSVTGLSVGSPVRYRGIPVGTVSEMRIDPTNVERIEVIIEVDQNVPVKRDAYAVLESQGLTGIGFIQIKGGSREAPDLLAKPGEALAVLAVRASAVEEVFETAPEIANQLVILINRASTILRPENQERMDHILTNVEAVTGAFAGQQAAIVSLVDDASKSAAILRETMDDAAPKVAEVLRGVDDLTEETSQTMSTLRGTASGLDAEVTRLGNSLDGTLTRLENAAFEAEGLLKENRASVRDFTESGLYELTQFLVEGRIMLEGINRMVRQLERDPSRFIFGTGDEGIKVK
ncbi:MAG: MCE family protein [Rhodospirillaceae bacterium]|jgi:phospholipid/cholesterol/gamma-HCH transport system substrate-binding protein|nr:MCE family protein [Rhodospirillaceae bacterium]MBT6137936.1 MCE family protein [Rhodospirillaceae bacterium]